MTSGTTRRLTIFAVLLALALLAPGALARPPVPNRDAAESTAGQDISDLATDPTGRFSTAVVVYDAAKGITPGGIGLPGTGGNTPARKDVYACDFGPATQPRAGSGCTGINQAPATGSNGRPQAVDVTTYAGANGLVPVYAIAGPGDTLTYWSHISTTHRWLRAHEGVPVTNVSVSPDGTRVAAGLTPANPATPGKLVLYDADGKLLWDLELRGVDNAAAKPTALAFSRDGSLLVVGTDKGLLFVNPKGAKPASLQGLSPVETAPVRSIVVASDGRAVTVGTTLNLYHILLQNGKPLADAIWNRAMNEGVTSVAMSLDGQRFAAASGNRISFYRATGSILVAEQTPGAHDAGAFVSDVAYDAGGNLLVAVAGDSVLGFGPDRTTPLWTFKATDAANGGLDGPLRKVTLSDGGERIVVAGRTKFMAYTNVVSASAAFGQGGATARPGVATIAAFTVTNTGSLPDNYTFIVRRPVAWSGANPDNLALDPDRSGVANVTIEVPPGTAPGVYPVSVEVRSRALNGVAATATLNVTLPRSVGLSLEGADERITLRQGGDRTVPLTIRNVGNAEGVVNLSVLQSVSGGAAWTARFNREQITVPAGGSADVELLVAAPADAASGVRNILTIRAREGADVEAVRTLIAYIDARFEIDLSATNKSLEFVGGESQFLGVTIRNVGNTEDTYNVTYAISPDIAAGDWKVTLGEDLKVTLGQGASRTLSVPVRPAVAEPRDATLTIRALSQNSVDAVVEEEYSILLSSRPVETTPEEENGIPGPAPLLVLALVGLAALCARRRGGSP